MFLIIYALYCYLDRNEYDPGMKSPLFSLFFTVLIDLLGVGLIIPILAPLFQNTNGILPMDASDTTRTIMMGLLYATYPLMQFFGAPLLGTWSDRYGRKKILLLALLGTLLGYVLFIFGISFKLPILLYLGRALDGFTGGNISIVQSAIADISKPEDRAKNFGLIGMAFGIGFVFGPFIGGTLSDSSIVSWFSYAVPFYLAAVLSVVNILLVARNVEETHPQTEKSIREHKSPIQLVTYGFTHPDFRMLFLVSLLFTFGFSSFTQFFQVFLVKKYAFTQSQIGYLFAFVGICIGLTQGILTRWTSSRYKPENILKVSIPATSLALLGYAITTQSWQLFLVVPFFAAFNGLTTPNLSATISRRADASHQGLILGITHAVQALGQALPAVLLAWLVAQNSANAIYSASFFIFLAWVTYIISNKKQAAT